MFTEADYGMTQMAFEDSNKSGYDQDSKLMVAFTMLPQLDKVKTKEEGRPIYTPREHVTILVPGDKYNVVRRPVTDLDRRRFSSKYAAFKAGKQEDESGTPLETVPWITREQVEELKFFNVRTLEHLAGLADNHAQRFMGINQLRTKARDAIALAKEQAPALKMAAELRERDERISTMEKQLALLSAKLEAQTTPAAKAK